MSDLVQLAWTHPVYRVRYKNSSDVESPDVQDIAPLAVAGRGGSRLISAADFFTVEVWGLRGLVTFYVLVVIELSSRRVYFAGTTPCHFAFLPAPLTSMLG
jgi:hypothetical protein